MNKSEIKTEEQKFFQGLFETLNEKSDTLSKYQKGDKLKLELKVPGEITWDPATAIDTITQDVRRDFITRRGAEWTHLADIIPTVQTTGSTVHWPIALDNLFDDTAPATAWGYADPITDTIAKPGCDMTLGVRTVDIEWLACLLQVPIQWLQDVPLLASFIRSYMLQQMRRSEDYYILHGTGANNEIQGILGFGQPYSGTLTGIEAIYDAAFRQMRQAGHMATHVVLNPADSVNLMFNKAPGSGEYNYPPGVVLGNDGVLRVGGLEVVVTPFMPAGQFLVIDAQSPRLVRRINPTVGFYDQDVDNVQRNMVTVRVEERFGLLLTYPSAFIIGSFAAAT